jgi:sulfide dehydrogenase cytochrome subunit
MILRKSAIGILVLTLAGLPAAAEDPRADMLAGSCAACHGTDGQSPGSIPAIAGISAEDMVRLLQAYRSGEATGTVMNRIARGFTDEEIIALAAHFAALR